MAHLSVLIMIESVDCRENALRRSLYSCFLEKFSDCGLLEAFPEVYFPPREAPLACIWRIGASHQQHGTIFEYCSDCRDDGPDRNRIHIAQVR